MSETTADVQTRSADNAAVLYNQCFAMVQQPADVMWEKLRELAKGKVEPTEKTAGFIRSHYDMVALVTRAARVQACDWALDYSKGAALDIPYLQRCRLAAWLTLADAQLLASKGQFKEAFERCVAVWKMSSHISKGPVICRLTGLSILHTAGECAADILPKLPRDLEILQWLSQRTDEMTQDEHLFESCLENDLALLSAYMTSDGAESSLQPGFVQWALAKLTKAVIEFALNHPGKFFERNDAYWKNYVSSVRDALKLPYAEAFGSFRKLAEKVARDSHSIDGAMTGVFAADLTDAFVAEIRTRTFSNAVAAAVAVYLARTQTGKMPDSLPENLPKDLFSGQDFQYEQTDDGFVLHCRGKDLTEGRGRRYQFRVEG